MLRRGRGFLVKNDTIIVFFGVLSIFAETAQGISCCDQCYSGYYTIGGRQTLTLWDQTTRELLCRTTAWCLIPCPAGEYRPETDCNTCTRCPRGTYSDGSAVTANQCATCPVGHWCINGIKSLCAAGLYADQADPGQCYYCPIGWYQPNNGASACLKCTRCAPGKYTTSTACNYVGSTQDLLTLYCATPPSGYYQDEEDRYDYKPCSTCSAGYRISAACTSSANTQCEQCPAGKYAVSPPSAAACVECAGGDFQPSAGSTSCSTKQTCGPGTYQSSPGNSQTDRSCASCTAPLTTVVNNALTCTSCVEGKYKSGGICADCVCTGQTYISCPAGSTVRGCPACYGGDQSASTCAAGMEPNVVCTGTQLQDSWCVPCPAGKQKPVTSNKWCEKCPTGTFSGDPGTGTCGPCTNKPSQWAVYDPWGVSDRATSSTCPWSCNAGYYKSGSECLACNNQVGKYGAVAGLIGGCSDCTNKPANSVYVMPSTFDGKSNNCPWCVPSRTSHT